MPCFLSGKSAAYAFGAGAGVPVYEFSHQNGHIMAALYSSGRLDLLGVERFLAFHVSGGTTEALLVRPRIGGFDVQLVGNTADINAGQAIDRVGVAMGMRFPCGAELERCAAEYSGRLPSHKVCVRDGICNLSGVENIAKKIFSDTGDKSRTAAFVFDFLGRTLEAMCSQIMDEHGRMPVVFDGQPLVFAVLDQDPADAGGLCRPAFAAFDKIFENFTANFKKVLFNWREMG